ncbi:MAG: O-antigen ligase family protein [Chloroflexi bacterium]|nr:O-antigen ligase family protein [Chloroflexota bacterium]
MTARKGIEAFSLSTIRRSREDAGIFLALGVSLLAYFYSPNLWLSAVAALAFGGLAWRRLDLALLYVVFTIPFYRYPKEINLGELGLTNFLNRTVPLEFSLAEVTVLICLVVWLAQWLRGRRGHEPFTNWEKDPFHQGAVAFLGVATLSLLASQYLKFSLREYRTVILEPLVFFFLLTIVLKGQRKIWRFLDAFLALSLLVSCIALLQYFFMGEAVTTGGVRRMLAIYYSPNALALFLGRGMPIALVLALLAPTEVGRGKRWFYVITSLAILVALYFTYSRGAWLAVGSALLLVGIVRRPKRTLVWGSMAAIAIVVAVPFLPWDRLLSTAPVEQRLNLWQASVKMVRDHPILGVGLDNFLYQYPKYRLESAWAEPNISHPHNILLDFWTRLGILGVTVMLWLQATFWSAATRLYRQWGSQGMGVITLALMASMVDFIVHGLIDNSFFLIDLAFVFWLIMALTRAVARLEKGEGSFAEAQ